MEEKEARAATAKAVQSGLPIMPSPEGVMLGFAMLETMGFKPSHQQAVAFAALIQAAKEDGQDEVKKLLAPYAWHAYNCPKMNDHACTCGMQEVRMKLWGNPERPAPEPFVRLHEDYAKPPKKVRDRMEKRNKT